MASVQDETDGFERDHELGSSLDHVALGEVSRRRIVLKPEVASDLSEI